MQEVTIRRRPPHGIEKQNCGPVDFKIPLQGAPMRCRLLAGRRRLLLAGSLLAAGASPQGRPALPLHVRLHTPEHACAHPARACYC